MGYYASGSGYIEFRQDITDEDFEEISSVLNNSPIKNYFDRNCADVNQDGNYFEEDWEELLEELTPFAKSGEINFCGEDDCFWRFIFRNGKFVDENGSVIYESEDKQNYRIRTALKTLISREENNLCLDSLYWLVRGAGLTDDDLKSLSLDYLIPVA